MTCKRAQLVGISEGLWKRAVRCIFKLRYWLGNGRLPYLDWTANSGASKPHHFQVHSSGHPPLKVAVQPANQQSQAPAGLQLVATQPRASHPFPWTRRVPRTWTLALSFSSDAAFSFPSSSSPTPVTFSSQGPASGALPLPFPKTISSPPCANWAWARPRHFPVQFRPRSPSSQPRPSTSIRTLIDSSLPPSPTLTTSFETASVRLAVPHSRPQTSVPRLTPPVYGAAAPRFQAQLPSHHGLSPATAPKSSIVQRPADSFPLLLREIPRSGRILRDQPSIDPASREARSRHSPVRPFGSLSLSSAATITCIRPTSRPRPPPDSSPRTRMPLAPRPQLVGLSIRP